MLAPQMPASRSVRQAVLHNQPHGCENHAVCIVALGQGQIIHVGIEVGAASGTMMLGVGDLDIPRPPADRVAQVVQATNDRANTIGACAAGGAAPASVVATPLADLGLRQILNTGNPFGCIAHVPSWPGHADILHESFSLESSAIPPWHRQEYSVLMLQSLLIRYI